MAKKEQGTKRGRDAGAGSSGTRSGGTGKCSKAKARRTGDAASTVAALARQCYARVAFFAFDDPAAAAPAVTFKTRYSADFEVAEAAAAAHVEQYLRFMALKAALLLAAGQAPAAAATGGAASAAATGVTPPLAVDAVWHTHLLYSRSYARLCAALLGHDAAAAPPGLAWQIPHEPSPGGDAAAVLFITQYAAASELYRDAFGEHPPAEVWTPAAHRFAPAQQIVGTTRGERAALRVMKASLEERMHAVSSDEEEYDDPNDYGGCG